MNQAGRDRITQIISVDEEWGFRMLNFFEKHPEFAKYAQIAQMTRRPNNTSRLTPFENAIHTIAGAGVRYDYALNQYKSLIENVFKNTETMKLFISEEKFKELKIQPKKISTYQNIIKILLSKSENPNPYKMTPRELHELFSSVSGIGEMTWHVVFSSENPNPFLPVTDRGFLGGFCTVYPHISKTSKAKIRAQINSLCDTEIANGMCFQIFHYGQSI